MLVKNYHASAYLTSRPLNLRKNIDFVKDRSSFVNSTTTEKLEKQVPNLGKSTDTLEGINQTQDEEQIKQVRNVSYLFQKEQNQGLYRPKKPTCIDIVNPQEFVDHKTQKIEEIKAILSVNYFPSHSDDLFDTLAELKLSFKERNAINKKWSKKKSEISKYELTSRAISKIIETDKINACYERSESMTMLKWLAQMKQLYNKNSDKNENQEAYFRNFKLILAYCYRELILNEEKRCKEKSLLLQQLYNEGLEYQDNVMEYIRLYMIVLDKNHKQDIEIICKEFGDQLDSSLLELKLLRDKYDSLREENQAFTRKTNVMRSKLANDYLVLKHLKADLAYSEDRLALTLQENRTISKIITNMNSQIEEKSFLTNTNQLLQMKDQIKNIGKIQDNTSIEMMNIQTAKNKKDQNLTVELTEGDSRHLTMKMGKNFEDDSELQNFKTREFGIQCTGFIRPVDKSIQHAAEGYHDQCISVDIYNCNVCEIYKREKKQSDEEFRQVNKLKIEGDRTIEELKKENSSLAKAVEDLKYKYEELLRNKGSVNKDNTQFDTDRSNTLNFEFDAKQGRFESMNLDDDMNINQNNFKMNVNAQDITNMDISLVAGLQSSDYNLASFWEFVDEAKFGDIDVFSNLDEENEEDLNKLDQMLPVDMLKLSKNSTLKIKEIFFKLKSKLQIIEEDGANEESADFIDNMSHTKKLKDRVNHYWTLLSQYLQIIPTQKNLEISSSKEIKKTNKKPTGASANKFRSIGSFNYENQSKIRHNNLISEANNTFNYVLQTIQDDIKPNKTFILRDKTLIKQIYRIYGDYANNKTKESNIEFNIYVYKTMSLSFSQKKLLIKNYKSVKFKINFFCFF